MSRNIYFVVCIIILSFTFCIITQVNADIKPQKESPLIEQPDNSDQITTENLKTLLRPIIFIFNILYILISYLWTFILYVLSPAFWILTVLYNVFILTPYTITQKIYSYFYPLYMFLLAAALVGVFVGGMGGWFSEVISKLLITNTSDGLTYEEQENNRLKAEKLKRRAQALANYKARNGGRMPDEFYDKYFSVQNKQGIIHGSNNYNNNMDYKSYAGTGLGDN